MGWFQFCGGGKSSSHLLAVQHMEVPPQMLPLLLGMYLAGMLVLAVLGALSLVVRIVARLLEALNIQESFSCCKQ